MIKIIRERLNRREVLNKISLTLNICSIGFTMLYLINVIRDSSKQNEINKNKFYEEKVFGLE